MQVPFQELIGDHFEVTNKLIKVIMPESKPSEMRTPSGVVTVKRVTNKIKELPTPRDAGKRKTKN